MLVIVVDLYLDSMKLDEAGVADGIASMVVGRKRGYAKARTFVVR